MFLAHLGLRSLVYTSGPCTPLRCDVASYEYGAVNSWPNEFMSDNLQQCRTIAYATAFGAFTTCATLLFALMGTMNRMKFSSDANIQKALGMITDLCGFISLTFTLWNMGEVCYNSIEREYTDSAGTKFEASVYLGPGYICYLVCLFGAFMRALFHWLGGNAANANNRSPASSKLSATARCLSRHLRMNALRRVSISSGVSA